VPITVHSHDGVVGSNRTRGIDVCVRLFYICVVLCVGSDLARAQQRAVKPLIIIIRSKVCPPGCQHQNFRCGHVTAGAQLLGEEKPNIASGGGHPQVPHCTGI
jgi:hypothetical protein